MPEPITLALQTLIDRATLDEAEELEAAHPPRDYLGASIIGTKCERALWYNFRWWDMPDFPARIYRRFETGNTYEERGIRRLRRACFEVLSHNPRARNEKKQWAGELGSLGGLVRGHMDGFARAPREVWIEMLGEVGSEDGALEERERVLEALADRWVLVEFKVLASAKYRYAKDDTDYLNPLGQRTKGGRTEGRWFEARRKGVLKARPIHWAQMQAYMGFSWEADRNGKIQHERWGLGHGLTHALYIGINGDTDQWFAELVPFVPRAFDKIKRRASDIVRATTPPPRKWENPVLGDCRFCDSREACHRSRPPTRVSCRSCEHAEIKIPGDRRFFGRQSVWVCKVHKANISREATPCDHYTTITGGADDVGF